MSNTIDFTGLEGNGFVKALKPLIVSHLPQLNAALSANKGKWAVQGNRFVFRYAPSGNYRREQLMLKLYQQDELSPEEQLMLELFSEAQGFRERLIDESGSSWDEVGSDEAPRNFPGLQLYIQDWWTTQRRGKDKRVHSGLELVFLAAEAEAEEEAEASDAPAGAHAWGEA